METSGSADLFGRTAAVHAGDLVIVKLAVEHAMEQDPISAQLIGCGPLFGC